MYNERTRAMEEMAVVVALGALPGKYEVGSVDEGRRLVLMTIGSGFWFGS
jgi:hypothetical protein